MEKLAASQGSVNGLKGFAPAAAVQPNMFKIVPLTFCIAGRFPCTRNTRTSYEGSNPPGRLSAAVSLCRK